MNATAYALQAYFGTDSATAGLVVDYGGLQEAVL